MGLSTLRARAPPSPSQASPEQLKSEATQGATSGLKSWPGPRGCALSLSGTSGWPALEPHSPERMDPRGARLCSPPAWQGHCHLLAPSRQPSTASLPQSASLPPGEEPAPRPGGGGALPSGAGFQAAAGLLGCGRNGHDSESGTRGGGADGAKSKERFPRGAERWGCCGKRGSGGGGRPQGEGCQGQRGRVTG